MTQRKLDPLMPIMADAYYVADHVSGQLIMGPFWTNGSAQDWLTANSPDARIIGGSSIQSS